MAPNIEPVHHAAVPSRASLPDEAASAWIRVGISGWRYAGWRGVFYPPDLPQRCELEFASKLLNSIEINGSFYSLQRPESYRTWYAQAPASFVFAVKGGRFITHMKKLADVEQPLANFFASGVLCLEDKLGPILWQLPEQVAFSRDRFRRFFDLLPRDTFEAARLARRHNDKMAGRSATSVSVRRGVRHAFEIRSVTCRSEALVELLREYDIALVVADTAKRFPYFEDVTADFVYARLHGDEELYASGYSSEAIERWARRVIAWSEGREPPDAALVCGRPAPRRKSRDVYVYFDNDAKVRAPFDAIALSKRLGLSSGGLRSIGLGESVGFRPSSGQNHPA